MKKLLFGFITLIISTFVIAAPHENSLIQHSRQLLVVTSSNWDDVNGQLQLYERNNTLQPWQAVGGPITVVVGRHGMAWGANDHNKNLPGPVKKESDLKTPAGVFRVGPTFGFAPSYIKNIKMPYIQITPSTVCVDDSKSKFYNSVVDTSKIKKSDWKSSEQMHQTPQYMWGVVIDYNQTKPVPGAGSCHFLHIWEGASNGTAGCVAMPEPNVEQLITWLNPQKKPVIVILPRTDYSKVQKTWGLPAALK